MDIASMIASLESKRTATQARMQALNELVAKENRTKADEERTEYRGLQAELTQIDEELVDQREFQRAQLSNATEISAAAGTSVAVGAQTRGGSTSVVNAASIQAAAQAHQHSGIVAVRPNVEKGIAFTRYVRALCMARGSPVGALAIAENNQNWKDTTPQVAKVLMAAVAAGDTTTAGWASELVYNQSLIAEFMEYLRPQTILGKLPQMTRVPFNIRMAGQTSGSTAYWVGQGKPVPVSKLTTTDLTLGIAKAEGLVVLTEELVRSSDPSAELLVRNDLTASIAAFLDVQFISPDYAAVANVSPASITSGVAPTAATAATAAALRTDVQTLFATWIANNLDPSSGAWIMTATQALAISLMLNSLGQPVFPDITMNGGTFFGLPVIVSQAAKQVGSPVSGEGNLIVLVNQKEILFADDGQVTIDASREASLEMLDNPTNQSVPSVTPTTQVSMFQTSSVAIKATRFINWKKRRDFAVAYIKDAAYVS
jgi:HK97 family phage major capsid protein